MLKTLLIKMPLLFMYPLVAIAPTMAFLVVNPRFKAAYLKKISLCASLVLFTLSLLFLFNLDRSSTCFQFRVNLVLEFILGLQVIYLTFSHLYHSKYLRRFKS